MSRVKKLVVCFFVTAVFLLICTAFAYAEINRVGTVTADVLNVRETASTSAKILVQIPRGTKVKVLEDSNEWCKITYNNITGWVSAQYLTISEEPIGTGVITGNSVNVRKGPDIGTDVLTRLDKGAKANVYERSGDWYGIRLADGAYGWVNCNYISVKTDSVSRGDTETANTGEQVEENADSSTLGEKIVEYAKKYLGVKYRYGGSLPKTGFDCSGFVSYVYKHFDINLERTSAGQSQHGTKVEKKNLKKGDLVFFTSPSRPKSIGHVGIYIGNGKFIHASSGSAYKVIISTLNEGTYAKRYVTARRYLQ